MSERQLAIGRSDPAIDGRRRSLGHALASRRKAAGMSARELGNLTGKARSTIATVETTGQLPPREFWSRCAALFGADLLVDYDALVIAAEPEHGTKLKYDRGCRCDVCRADNTRRHQEWQTSVVVQAVDVPHGLGGYRNYRCRCTICVQALRDCNASEKQKEAHRKYITTTGRERFRQRTAEAHARYQAETLERAFNYGKHWTGPELEMVLREDLTRKEIALALGRSLEAVKTARALARHDPRKRWLAGVAP